MVRLKNPLERQEDLANYYKTQKAIGESQNMKSLSNTVGLLSICQLSASLGTQHGKNSLKISVTIAFVHEKET